MKKKVVGLLLIIGCTVTVLAGCQPTVGGNPIAGDIDSHAEQEESQSTSEEDFFGTFDGKGFSEGLAEDELKITDAGYDSNAFVFEGDTLTDYTVREGDTLAKVEWRGCTFGCSMKEVREAYGEPLAYYVLGGKDKLAYEYEDKCGVLFTFEEINGGSKPQLTQVEYLDESEVKRNRPMGD